MRSAATYRIFGGPGLTAAEVTRRLGVRPTTAAEAGRRTSAVRAESLWCLSTSTADTEPAAHLRQVLDVLSLPGELLLDVCGDETG